MGKPNVVFIAVDDLRTALGCYGDSNAITPNIDRLAAGGMLFQRAYCQQAVCNPSRASLMTGLRPDTIKVWDLKSHFRHELPDRLAELPQYCGGSHFRAARPDVVTLARVLQAARLPSRVRSARFITARRKRRIRNPGRTTRCSMSSGKARTTCCRRIRRLRLSTGRATRWRLQKPLTRRTSAYGDGKVADAACELIANFDGAPFFLAVGFRKPHLPFSAPKRYWDLYERDAISAPENADKPVGIPDFAWHNSVELRGYSDVPSADPFPTTWSAGSGTGITPASATWTPRWASCLMHAG